MHALSFSGFLAVCSSSTASCRYPVRCNPATNSEPDLRINSTELSTKRSECVSRERYCRTEDSDNHVGNKCMCVLQSSDCQHIAAGHLKNPINRSSQPSKKHSYSTSNRWTMELDRAGSVDILSEFWNSGHISNHNNHKDNRTSGDFNCHIAGSILN